MAVPRKLSVSDMAVFPIAPYLVTPVEPVLNFDKAALRPDGSRPQMLDKLDGANPSDGFERGKLAGDHQQAALFIC